MRVMIALALLAGCAELGVVGDGTTISWGRPHGGIIVDPVRLPDSGEGFLTREQWRRRGNRYGTDEMIDLISGVARRMATQTSTRLVVADIGAKGGGPALAWHRSHQTGRDVDLLFYYLDANGRSVEADAMRIFDRNLKATDGTNYSIDVPRTWMLVRELLTAHEATTQHIFLYQALVDRLVSHAIATKEPEDLIAKARLALKQPGRSAPHDDHIHVRIYCAPTDRAHGCLDHGSMELLELAGLHAGPAPSIEIPRMPLGAIRR